MRSNVDGVVGADSAPIAIASFGLSSWGVPVSVSCVGAVVLSADTSNVDTVIVAGKVHKRDGRLVADWESARRAVQASSEHLRDALERRRAEAKADA